MESSKQSTALTASSQTSQTEQPASRKDSDPATSSDNNKSASNSNIVPNSRAASSPEEFLQKIKRLENQQNQDKIKIQSLKKTITKLQDKQKQHKQSMEKMYEECLIKTEKIAYLEEKLKEYKREIQKQKAQKAEIQETNQRKLNQLIQELDEAMIMQHSRTKYNPVSTADSQASEKEYELVNKINTLETQVNIADQEAARLVREVETLRQENLGLNETIKTLQQKRQQAISEIQKLQRKIDQMTFSSRGIAGLIQQNKQQQQQQQQPTAVNYINVDRAKRVAQKAHRGFQIILKLLDPLYKGFVSDFSGEMGEQRVRKVERAINQLVIKSSDMQDVFRDYIS